MSKTLKNVSSVSVVIDKDYFKVFPITEKIEALEGRNGPDSLMEYVRVLEVIKKDIEVRIANAKVHIANNYKTSEIGCETCGEEAGWGGCDNGFCPEGIAILEWRKKHK